MNNLILEPQKSKIDKALAVVFSFVLVANLFSPLSAYAASNLPVQQTITFQTPGASLWTVPVGVTDITVQAWGGGGSAGNGEKIDNHYRGSLGGGGGGYTSKTFTVVPGDTYLVTVGQGGQGIKSVYDGRLGNPGGDTTFSGTTTTISLIAHGGLGGATDTGLGNPTGPVGYGGSATGGDINLTGNDGGPYSLDPNSGTNPWASSGGSSPNGGAGGLRGSTGRLNLDGYNPDGNASVPQDGGFPGGGGGGSNTGTGGFGANGEVIIQVLTVPVVTPVDYVPTGALDSASCTSFNGWSLDYNHPASSTMVSFYADGPVSSGTFVGSMLANSARPDLNAIGIVGDHGFTYPTPASLKDGHQHVIYAYGINLDANNPNAVLPSSANVTFTCQPPVTPPPPQPPVTPTPQYVLTVNLPGTGTGTITSTPTGMTCTTTSCTGTYDQGTSVVLTATPAANSVFTGWQGGSCSGTGTCTVVVNAAATVTATFSPVVVVVATPISIILSVSTTSVTVGANVTASTTASGGTLTQHGVETCLVGGNCPVNVSSGDWTNIGANNAPVNPIDVFSASSVLNAVGTYNVRAYASNDGGVTYTYSNTLTVAVATAGGGGGGGGGGGNPTHVLEVLLQGSGTVTSNPAGISCSSASGCSAVFNTGTPITLTETPATGNVWSTWGGDCAYAGTSSTCSVVLTADLIAHATFTSAPTSTPTNNPPSAPIITGPTTGTTSISYSFTASSTDPDGGNITYLFDWNNNGTINATSAPTTSGFPVNQSNSWATAGAYTFAVVAVDSTGETATSTYSIVISNTSNGGGGGGGGGTSTSTAFDIPGAPVITGPTTGDINVSYAFSASSTDATSSPLTYFFDWNNDGITDATTAPMTSGFPVSLSYTWPTVGTYTFAVVVANPSGATATSTYSIVISDPSTGGGGGSTGGGGGNNGGGGGSSSGGGGSTGGGGHSSGGNHNGVLTTTTTTTTANAQVNAPVTPVVGPSVCKAGDYITAYMRQGIDNDPAEVTKLQNFLNTYEGANLNVNGVFDASTTAAVKDFQVKYAKDVLSPWGIDYPTGVVYVTTAHEINNIFCSLNPDYIGGPAATTTSQFDGAVGFNNASSTISSNVASVIGAFNQSVKDFLKDILWYPLLILLLLGSGIWIIMRYIFLKDKKDIHKKDMFVAGLELFAGASVLNIANTLLYMLTPAAFMAKTNMTVGMIAGLDLINIVLMLAASIAALYMFEGNVFKRALSLV